MLSAWKSLFLGVLATGAESGTRSDGVKEDSSGLLLTAWSTDCRYAKRGGELLTITIYTNKYFTI